MRCKRFWSHVDPPEISPAEAAFPSTMADARSTRNITDSGGCVAKLFLCWLDRLLSVLDAFKASLKREMRDASGWCFAAGESVPGTILRRVLTSRPAVRREEVREEPPRIGFGPDPRHTLPSTSLANASL